jgi:hypothetical protein
LAGRKQEAEAKNAQALAAERGARQNDIRAIVDEYKAKIAAQRGKGNALPLNFDSLDESLNGYVGDGSRLDRFISASTPALDENMFLADDEVSTLNNAAGLLGSGQIYQRGTAGNAGAKLNADALRRELDALLNPGLQAAENERANNALAAAQRLAAQTTQSSLAKALAKGNTNAATKSATGGNEGVTGGGTTVPKNKTPIPATPKKAATNQVKSVVDAVKNSKVAQVATAPVKAVENLAESGKKKAGKILSGKW